MPTSTANLNDGLVAFKDGKMVRLCVPYPLGFYAKGFDGRAPWLMEGGKGKKPIVVHFQLRPDPLAR